MPLRGGLRGARRHCGAIALLFFVKYDRNKRGLGFQLAPILPQLVLSGLQLSPILPQLAPKESEVTQILGDLIAAHGFIYNCIPVDVSHEVGARILGGIVGEQTP